jgi:hypothetical protein
VSYPGEEAVYQASFEEAQAVEVRRKHVGLRRAAFYG